MSDQDINREGLADAREAITEQGRFVADPANPTDAELAAAIQRGLADGSLVDAEQWLARERRNEAGYDEDSYGLPADTAPAGIRCGNHPRNLGIRHENPAAVRACYAIGRELEAQQAGEIYAEAGMSWVAGGGSPEDARFYASWVASGREWNGGI